MLIVTGGILNTLVVFIVYGKDVQTESLTDQILPYVPTRCPHSKNTCIFFIMHGYRYLLLFI
jgi:hypothetical protein